MPPIPQAPGFPPACPDWCPLDGWALTAGWMTDALVVTTVVLALAVLIAFLGQSHSTRELVPLLPVGLCALIAVLSARRLLQLDLPIVLGDIHYSPTVAALWEKRVAEQFALMVGPLSALAFAFAAGVSLAIATLVRHVLHHQ